MLLSPFFKFVLPPGLLDALLTAVRVLECSLKSLGTHGDHYRKVLHKLFHRIAQASFRWCSGSACPGSSDCLVEIGVLISQHQVTGA